MRRFLSIAGFVLTFGLALVVFAQGKEITVPGTKTKLTPPSNFKLTDQFPGFIDEATGASIMVTEIPGPYAQVSVGFDKAALATKGMQLLSRQAANVSQRPGLLLSIRQAAQGESYLKWVVATGTESETVIVTAVFPEALKARLSTVLQRAVLSAKWEAAATVDPMAGLLFSIQDDPALRIAKRFSNLLLLTKDGKVAGKPTMDPIFVVGPSFSQVSIIDRKSFAEQRLQETDGATNLKIRQQTEITLDNLPGYEIVAEGQATKFAGQAMTVYQIILFDEKSYFIIQAQCAAADESQHLPIFQKVAQTFRKK